MCSEHSMFAKPQLRCDSQTNARSRHDNKNTIQYTAETPREWEIIMEMKRKYREENKNDNEIKRTLRILIQFERVVWEREKDLVCVSECVSIALLHEWASQFHAIIKRWANNMQRKWTCLCHCMGVLDVFECKTHSTPKPSHLKLVLVVVGLCVCICCTFCISLTPDSSL